jgi:alkylhydroperoxidase family enzyme
MTRDARLAPVSDADWPDEIAAMRHGFAGGLNVYRTMAHHPALLGAWATLREHLVRQSALDPERLEIAILRTGHRLGSSYEWAQHVQRARKVGLSDTRIRSIKGRLAAMAPEDALIAGAVDELFDHARLRSATLGKLTSAVGKEGVLDLLATVGFYSTLGFLLNTFAIPLDDDIAAELAARPLRDGD